MDPQSRPGYTTVVRNGRLVTVPTNQSTFVPGVGVVTPSLRTGGGGGNVDNLPTPSPQSTPPLIQSTATNQAQVQAELAAAKRTSDLNRTKKALELQAQLRIQGEVNNQIARIGNFKNLPSYQQNQIINKFYGGAYDRANTVYQKSMEIVQNEQALKRSAQTPPKAKPLVLNKSFDLGPLGKTITRGNIGKINNWFYDFVDKFSGGKLTGQKVDNLQESLNRKVDTYNLKYSEKAGPLLSSSAAEKAQSEYLQLVSAQEAIDATREGSGKFLQDQINSTSTKQAGAKKLLSVLGIGKVPSKKSLEVQGAGTASALADLAVAGVNFPSGIQALIKNPSSIKEIPKNVWSQLKESVVQDAQIIKVNPNLGIARIQTQLGIQFLILRGTDKGLKAIGSLSRKVINKIDPLFKGVAKTGQTIKLFGASGKTLKLKIVGSIPKESISSQLKRAGTTTSAISSQADTLVGLIKRGKAIRKPIPGETSLPKSVRNLIKRFDKGTLNKTELIKLDKLLKKSKKKGILERTFFADPNLRIRPSRLGVLPQGEVGLSDIFKGQFTFKRGRPQILLFEDIKIQNFPKSLKGIVKKVKAGKPLTSAESAKLLKFQLKPSGKFKPLGFVTRESEITLAPGEIVKRVKRLGTIEVNGRRVPIIKTKVVKASLSTKKLLKKVQSGKINPKELTKLKKSLRKETGFKDALSYTRKGKKYLSPRRVLSKPLSRTLSRVRARTYSYKPSQVKYTSSGKPYVKTPYGSRFISPSKVSSPGKIPISPARSPPRSLPRSPPRSPPKSPPKSPPRYPPGRPPARPPTRLLSGSERLKIKSLSKASPTFNVFVKSGKKFLKVTKKPLLRESALSRGTYLVDNTTSKQFKIIPAGKRKKVGMVTEIEKNYFKRAGYKLREYKVKRGKKFAINPKYIERRKYGIDTSGEKRGLSVSRFLKQRTRPKAIRRTIKISASRRREMLRNLKKARAVRMNMLRRRK